MKQCALALALMVGLSSWAWPKPPLKAAPQDPASLAAGKTLFEANCVSCHGPLGKGDGPAAEALDPRPRDLSAPKYKYGDADDVVFVTVSKGNPASGMAPWSPKLTTRQIWQLVAYLKTLRAASPSP